MNPADEIDPDATDERFETAIRETVDAIGGVLLFQLKIDDGKVGRWTAAVAMGEAGALEVVIIDLPCDGDSGDINVSPASESKLPIASIATAYAGLAECWRSAA